MTVCLPAEQLQCRVHRLVASAFIDNPQCLPEVNHLDFDRTNNYVSNLEWVTASGNQIHASKHDRWKNHKGERSQAASISDARALEVYSYRGKMTVLECAETLGLHKAIVRNVWSGRRWSSVTGAIVGQAARKDPDVISPGEKRCSTCKVIQSVANFNRCAGKADGLQQRCRVCAAASNKARNAR